MKAVGVHFLLEYGHSMNVLLTNEADAKRILTDWMEGKFQDKVFGDARQDPGFMPYGVRGSSIIGVQLFDPMQLAQQQGQAGQIPAWQGGSGLKL